ncbi:MAG TPA: cytochrome c [Rhodothermales bacterium]|nr:cytochrome c [Rhodothermales bacterium]
MRSPFSHWSGWLRLGACLLVLPLAFFGVHLHHLQTQDTSAPSAGPPAWSSPQPALAYSGDPDGEKIYVSRCMSCHQTNGQGINGVFPPLDGTDWVVGDKGRIVRIVLHGMMGETTVQGKVYSGAMPPWGTFLDDEQVAAVVTYIRSSWSNEADAVSAKEVALVREATKERKTPWTEEELKQEDNLGIPGQQQGFPNVLGTPPDSTGR